MTARVSYQAPTRALANFGLSARVLVLTIARSMISPGILEESNTSCAALSCSISSTSGFQVATEVTSAECQAATMSASEVLTTVTSRSLMPFLASARASR